MIPDAILQIPCLMTPESILPCHPRFTMFPVMPCSIAGTHIISVSHVDQLGQSIPFPFYLQTPKICNQAIHLLLQPLNPSIHDDNLSGTVPSDYPPCYPPLKLRQEDAIVRSGRVAGVLASGTQRRASHTKVARGGHWTWAALKGRLNHTERYMQRERSKEKKEKRKPPVREKKKKGGESYTPMRFCKERSRVVVVPTTETA